MCYDKKVLIYPKQRKNSANRREMEESRESLVGALMSHNVNRLVNSFRLLLKKKKKAKLELNCVFIIAIFAERLLPAVPPSTEQHFSFILFFESFIPFFS